MKKTTRNENGHFIERIDFYYFFSIKYKIVDTVARMEGINGKKYANSVFNFQKNLYSNVL